MTLHNQIIWMNGSTGRFINVGIINRTKVQDLLFMENKEWKIDKNIYAHMVFITYRIQDFDLTQFGIIFLADMLYGPISQTGSKMRSKKLIWNVY